ncbi:MAG: hypothetical protein EBU90_04850 [Proteobacteria bacterium]|nr:hypothetical protein [Pseudomonadota bacterium]NBP13753.1 hypothetical protein [bacterium]
MLLLESTSVMIRAKSFQAKKRLPLNRFLDFGGNDDMEYMRHCIFYLSKHLDDYTDFIEIKSGWLEECEYKISRESNTGTWMLMCPDIVIMYLKPSQLEELEISMDKGKYCFHVYKTEDFLVVFLVSHKAEQINLLELQLFHGCNHNYAFLSHVLTPFVILNQSCSSKMELLKETFELHSILGDAEPNSEITHFINLVRKLKSLYNKLPPHYLNL